LKTVDEEQESSADMYPKSGRSLRQSSATNALVGPSEAGPSSS
jgi:hypothetical protein